MLTIEEIKLKVGDYPALYFDYHIVKTAINNLQIPFEEHIDKNLKSNL